MVMSWAGCLIGTTLRPGDRAGVTLPGPEGLWVVTGASPEVAEEVQHKRANHQVSTALET